MENFAAIDNNLMSAQLAIGESSNLAQICLTYTYNFPDQKYEDYACILAVLAQVAIDNAKRRFDVNLPAEIRRIKKDMNINAEDHGLPLFWSITKKDAMKEKNLDRKRKKRKALNEKINPNLQCPMNDVCNLKFEKTPTEESTIPIGEFFVKHKMTERTRKSRKVENLIQEFSLDLFNYNTREDADDKESFLLLRSDFDALINAIRRTYISKNYQGMMSWLIERAFDIRYTAYKHVTGMRSTLNTNRPLLLKVLYEVNNEAFLNCFATMDKMAFFENDDVKNPCK